MTADQIARLAIALDEVKPPVRRRIEVPLTIRLDRLHQVFQVVMGWEDYHLYEFRIGRNIAYGHTEKFRNADSRSRKINNLAIPTVAFSAFFSVSLIAVPLPALLVLGL